MTCTVWLCISLLSFDYLAVHWKVLHIFWIIKVNLESREHKNASEVIKADSPPPYLEWNTVFYLPFSVLSTGTEYSNWYHAYIPKYSQVICQTRPMSSLWSCWSLLLLGLSRESNLWQYSKAACQTSLVQHLASRIMPCPASYWSMDI